MKLNMSKWLGASVLLMLSLEAALLVAGVDDDLRLPSDTQVEAAAARPWKCCDTAGCTKSIPPICHCADEVERCGPTCKRCEASTLHPSLFVCKDRYVGDPGPMCRPWKCCDGAACTKSIPPICRCGDEVDECAATCKKCVASPTNPSRYVCKDTFRGFPGPICRPWDCCDLATCTKSIPPICHCRDEVEQCAATCGDCTASTADPSRNVCNDQYRGDPGPRCTDEGVGTAVGNKAR